MRSVNTNISMDINFSVINQNFTQLDYDIANLRGQVTKLAYPISVGGAGTLALAKEIVIKLLQIGESYRYECTHTTNINVKFEITYYINNNKICIKLENDKLIYDTRDWKLDTLLRNRNLLESIFLKFKEDLYTLNTINA